MILDLLIQRGKPPRPLCYPETFGLARCSQVPLISHTPHPAPPYSRGAPPLLCVSRCCFLLRHLARRRSKVDSNTMFVILVE